MSGSCRDGESVWSWAETPASARYRFARALRLQTPSKLAATRWFAVGLSATTPVLGLRQAEQPGCAELGEHAVGIGLCSLVLVDFCVEELVGDVAGQRDEFGGLWERDMP